MTTEYIVKPQKDYWYVHKIETAIGHIGETITTYTVQRVNSNNLFHCDCPANYRTPGKCKHVVMVQSHIAAELFATDCTSDIGAKRIAMDCEGRQSVTITPQNDPAAATFPPQSWRKLRL